VTNSVDILITGGTGYIGRHLLPVLLDRGHRVRVLTRPASVDRILAGATAVVGDALDAASVGAAMRPGDTVIHLVGTPHPNPSKARQFEEVDLASIRATVAAAKSGGISHLLYVSVAQPAPVMRAFLWVRTLGETMIREAELTATIVRPWYVLGPGHRWPVLIKPLYKLAEIFPGMRDTADRLGFVTIDQMVNALVSAVENPPSQGRQRIVDVPKIKSARL
jgi:nucleoside-diphosphate-sugar epimerase